MVLHVCSQASYTIFLNMGCGLADTRAQSLYAYSKQVQLTYSDLPRLVTAYINATADSTGRSLLKFKITLLRDSRRENKQSQYYCWKVNITSCRMGTQTNFLVTLESQTMSVQLWYTDSTFCYHPNTKEMQPHYRIVSMVLSVTKLMPVRLKHYLGITDFWERYIRYRKYSVRVFFKMFYTSAARCWITVLLPPLLRRHQNYLATVTQTNSLHKSLLPKSYNQIQGKVL